MDQTLSIEQEMLENRQARLKVTVPEPRVREALQKAARQLGSQRQIPGFRPGKAPYAIIERTFGKPALYEKVVDDLGQTIYEEALKQSGLEPYGMGNMEAINVEPFVLTVTVPLSPEVDPADYRSVRVESPQVEVTDEDVDNLLNDLRKPRSVWEPVERATQVGDQLSIDIAESVNDQEIMDQKEWLWQLEAGSDLLPGFNDALLGLQVGEEKDFDLQYPESARRYAGQSAHFHVKLLGVKERYLPELNDAFAAEVSADAKTLDELKTELRQNLITERTAEAERQYRVDVLKAVVEQAKLDYPPIALENEIDNYLQDTDRLLHQQGMSLDTLMQLRKQTVDAYREEVKPNAENRLKERLLLQEIANKERIAVSDEEIDAHAREYLEGAGDQAEQMEEALNTEAVRHMLMHEVQTGKAVEFLVSVARGEAPPLPPADAEPVAHIHEPEPVVA